MGPTSRDDARPGVEVAPLESVREHLRDQRAAAGNHGQGVFPAGEALGELEGILAEVDVDVAAPSSLRTVPISTGSPPPEAWA